MVVALTGDRADKPPKRDAGAVINAPRKADPPAAKLAARSDVAFCAKAVRGILLRPELAVGRPLKTRSVSNCADL